MDISVPVASDLRRRPRPVHPEPRFAAGRFKEALVPVHRDVLNRWAVSSRVATP